LNGRGQKEGAEDIKSHRSCPKLVEEERESDEMIERSMLRGGVGETRGMGLPKIDRRRVGDDVEFNVGVSSRSHVWRSVCDGVTAVAGDSIVDVALPA